jgi:hypothetical protein
MKGVSEIVIAASFVLSLVHGGHAAAADDTAADRITLRDGTVAKGLVSTVSAGRGGSVELFVRRAWAEQALAKRFGQWEHASAGAAKAAIRQRRDRLEAWRRERAPNVVGDDRIIRWIDGELLRLAKPGATEASVLAKVRIPRGEIASVDRRPAPVERLLRLAWLCNLPDPETLSVDELKTTLEARGYALDELAKKPPASLDRLLALAPESDLTWLGRRAATELAVDNDLRFIRFHDTVLADSGAGQPLAGAGLATAVGELKRLLDLDPGPKPDPLAEKLNAIANRGRIGAVVTALEIQPDISAVTVESTLWVRQGKRWLKLGSRNASVRPDDLGQDAGKDLAEDPQVKSAFQIADLLGLGAIAPEVKSRSLKIGAATEKALSTVRAAAEQDLGDLALPVSEPAGDAPGAPGGRPGN